MTFDLVRNCSRKGGVRKNQNSCLGSDMCLAVRGRVWGLRHLSRTLVTFWIGEVHKCRLRDAKVLVKIERLDEVLRGICAAACL